MEIERAQELGLCFGVRQAIKLLRKAASKYGRIETLGPVAHNRQLVQGLTAVGVEMVDSLDLVQGTALAIPAHGVSPEVLSEIEARHIRIIDTTCPIVRKAQNAAEGLAKAGFTVVIFGEAEHSEVKGLLGWAGGQGIAVCDVKEINTSRHLSRLGIMSQTTQNHSAFVEFTKQVMATFSSKIKEMRIINTLCKATKRRQEAAVRLAKRSELMLVLGGYNSANTRRLFEVCSSIVETQLIETADEVKASWLTGKERVGVTAGASTPDEAIEELLVRLKSYSR